MIKKFNIELSPEYMNNSIRDTLLSKLQDKYVNKTCKDGYITRLNSIISIDDSYINDNTYFLIFVVSCDVDIFTPEVDLELDCTVHLVINHGIIAYSNIVESLSIFIPISNLGGMGFKGDMFTSDTMSIRRDDDIRVKITSIKYEKKNYKCIATI